MYDVGLGTSPMMGKYCGDSIPPSHISSSNEVLIHFQSDWGYTYNGFKMEYNPLGKTRVRSCDSSAFIRYTTLSYHFEPI